MVLEREDYIFFSDRDIQRSQAESENKRLKEQLDSAKELISMQQKQIESLLQQVAVLQSNYERVHMQNLWMTRVIVISVDRALDFLRRIKEITLISTLRLFVQESLPLETTPEELEYVTNALRVPLGAPEQPTIGHADQVVVSVENGAQVVHTQNEAGSEEKEDEKEDEKKNDEKENP